MDRLVESIKIIAKKEAFECISTGVPLSEIKKMEDELGIVFPLDYSRFLSDVGYVSWFGHAILGHSPEDSDYDTVYQTLRMRNVPLPVGFTPIRGDGNIVMKYAGGGYYFLTAQGSPDEGRVVLFTDDYGGRPSQHWDSFTDFVAHFSRF
jgi:antitoxin YobK